MPATNVQYDDRAAAFFGIAMLAMFVIPSSIIILRTVVMFKEEDDKEALPKGRSKDEAEKIERMRASKPKKVLWTKSLQVCTAVTVAAFAILLGIVYSVRETTLAAYDPYKILGLDSGASDLDIKKAYRSLSRTHHPDKGGDAEEFQKISKAYQALSDEEAKKNWEKYGNPDGKQALEVGLGLPSVMLHPQLRYLFLLGYLGIFAVVSRALFALRNKNEKTVFNLLDGSLDWIRGRLMYFAKAVPRTLPETMASIEDLRSLEYTNEDLNELERILAVLGDNERPRIFFTSNENGPMVLGVPRSNTVLLHAHLSRVIVGNVSASLQKKLNEILETIPISCSFAVKFCAESQMIFQILRAMRQQRPDVENRLDMWQEIIKFQALCVQGLSHKESTLLQIFTPEESSLILKSQRGLDIRSFLNLNSKEKDSLLTSVIGPVGNERRDEVDRISQTLPVIEVNLEFGVASIKGGEFDEDGNLMDSESVTVTKGTKKVAPKLRPTIYEGNIVTANLTIRHKNLSDDAAVPHVYSPNFPSILDEEWHVWVLDPNDLVMQLGSENDPQRAPIFYQIIRPKLGLETLTTASFPVSKADSKRLTVVVKSSVYLGLDIEASARYTVLSKSEEPEPEITEEERANLAEAEGEEEEEDDHDQQDEVIERSLFANIDESDVSDESDAEGEDGKKKSRKSNTPLRSPQQKAVGTREGAGATPAEDDEEEDDGFAPSILTGASQRKKKVSQKKVKKVREDKRILPSADSAVDSDDN